MTSVMRGVRFRASLSAAVLSALVAYSPTVRAETSILLTSKDQIGPSKESIKSISRIAVAANGALTSLAELSDPNDPDQTREAVIFIGQSAQAILAAVGRTAPNAGTGARVYKEVKDPSISSDGDVAFLAETTSTSGSDAYVAIYSWSGGKAPVEQVRTGVDLVGVYGSIRFEELSQPWLSRGDLYFLGRSVATKAPKPKSPAETDGSVIRIPSPSSGGPSSNGQGVFLLKGGRIERLNGEGAKAAGLPGGKLGQIQELSVAGDQFLFTASVSGRGLGGSVALFSQRGGSQSFIARTGASWSGGPSLQRIEAFSEGISTSPGGSAAFFATVKDFRTGDADTGIFLLDGGKPKLIIGPSQVPAQALPAQKDDGRNVPRGKTGRANTSVEAPKPSIEPGTIGAVRAVAVNDQGDLALVGRLGDAEGASEGVFLMSSGKVQPIVEVGDVLTGDVTIRSISDHVGVTSARLVLFVAELEDDELVVAVSSPKPPRRTGRIITNKPGLSPGFGRQDAPRSRRDTKSSWEPGRKRVGRPAEKKDR
jgi:hypothetical protein